MTEPENGTGGEGEKVDETVAAPVEAPRVVEEEAGKEPEVVPENMTPEVLPEVVVTDAAEAATPEAPPEPVVESAAEIEVQEEPAPAEQAPARSEHASVSEPTPEPTPAPAPVSTTVSSVLKLGLEKIRFRKRAKLEKIVALAREKGSITNDDVQLAVHVSDSTATRYLTELILAGRLRRSGPVERPKYEPV